MPYDSFSNEHIPKGKGIMYCDKNGRVHYFKNSKTMANALKLKRDGRKVPWTKKTLSLTTDKKKVEKKDSELAKEIEKKLAQKQAEKEKKEGAKKKK